MAEGMGFCVVLFLALYGVFCILRRLSLQILKPSERLCTFTLAYLHKDAENAEQIIRYFRAQAEEEHVLLLVDNGVSPGEEEVIRKMCENRQDVRFLSAKNFPEENCIYGKDII